MSVTADYLDLITPWHSRRPRFRATVEGLVDPVVRLQQFLAHLPEDFDIDEAIGNQLDVVGEWVGRNRFVKVPLANVWFSFDDGKRGLDKGYWKGPYDSGFGLYRLDDETYRQVLYAKIKSNTWDGTVLSAKAAVDQLIAAFPDTNGTHQFVQDTGDGSMVFGIAGHVPSSLLVSLWSDRTIPFKPDGVRAYFNITSVEGTPIFGFDITTSSISGFDVGTFPVDPDYVTQHDILPSYLSLIFSGAEASQYIPLAL